MSFNSAPFWAFCVVVVCLHYLVPRRLRWMSLLAASYLFYGSFGFGILALLMALTAFVYVVTLVMERASGGRRQLLLLADIGGPLLALIGFRYLNLFWQSFDYARQVLHGQTPAEPFNILVPIGISFYVFKLLSYCFEVYHRRFAAEQRLGYFALYVAYFPQILAGPIERPAHLLPQLHQPASFDPRAVFEGLKLVCWGLFKKLVVADRLAYYVGEVFVAPRYKGLHLVFAAWFYYFQIYCDFSGYSDISVGISRALGFSPPVNFNYPYLSRDISQFWTRWHITLSTWLRDYLFLPITYAVMRRMRGDRWLGVGTELWGYAVGMSVTMVLGGLWHGAAWTFAAWGVLHGIYLITSYATRHARRRFRRAIHLNASPRLHHALSVILTFNLVAFAWIPFRATSFTNVHLYLKYAQLHLPSVGVANLLFDVALVLVLLGMEYAQRHHDDLAVVARLPVEAKAVGYALFVVVLIVLGVDSNNPFIYFRF